MTKQLQDKIIRLQAEKNQQESEFIQKKQHYQSIIQELQNQNQKLRKYIEDNQPLSLIESQANSNKSSKVSSPVHEYGKAKQVADDEREKGLSMNELTEENKLLKQELSNLTKTYEQQMQEMTNYFNKIQETYSIISQKVRSNPKEGQINDLVHAYENLLKDFESERMKYVDKIEQLTNYIIRSEDKQKEINEENEKLLIELKIVKEQLKIYKRSKIVK